MQLADVLGSVGLETSADAVGHFPQARQGEGVVEQLEDFVLGTFANWLELAATSGRRVVPLGRPSEVPHIRRPESSEPSPSGPAVAAGAGSGRGLSFPFSRSFERSRGLLV